MSSLNALSSLTHAVRPVGDAVPREGAAFPVLDQQEAVQAAQQAAERTAAEQPPQPPQPPAEATPAAVGVDVPGMGAVMPMTRQQLRAFDARTDELSRQLTSAQGRREDLVDELADATSPTVRAGLEARIQQLDARLLSIEEDIAANGKLKSSLAAKLGSVSGSDAEATSVQASGPIIQRSFFDSTPAMLMMAVVGVAAARYLWRRARVPAPAAVVAQNEARFQALEQAIDSVAIEVERVSEGQRFMAKLLREGQPIPEFISPRASETAMRSSGEGAR